MLSIQHRVTLPRNQSTAPRITRHLPRHQQVEPATEELAQNAFLSQPSTTTRLKLKHKMQRQSRSLVTRVCTNGS